MSQIEVKNRQIQALSYVLSAVTWLTLGKMIGDNGITYFAVAAESFLLLFNLVGGRLSESLGRILRSRYMKDQFKNADRVKSNILIFQSVLGILGAVLLFFLAPVFAEKVFCVPYATLALRILAPALAVRVVSQIFLGYFLGSGTVVPGTVIQVLRQILYFVFAFLFVKLMYAYGDKVKLLLRNECLPSMYGAAGMAIAVAVSELLLLLLVLFLYFLMRKAQGRRQDGLRNTESFSSAVGSLYGGMAPYLLADVLSRLPIWLGTMLFLRRTEDLAGAAVTYGKYYGKFLIICMVPVLICGCFLHSLSVRTARAARKGEQQYTKALFGTGFHMGIVVALFPVVFFTVLSTQVSHLTEGTKGSAGELGRMFLIGSAVILFAVLAQFFLRTIIYMDRMKLALLLLLLYAAVFGVVLVLFGIDAGTDVLIGAGLISLFVLCLCAGAYLFRILRIRPDYLYWLGIPAGAAAASGLLCYLLARFMTPYMGYLITVLVSFVLGLIVYWSLLILLRDFRRQELDVIPGGFVIERFSTLFYGSRRK